MKHLEKKNEQGLTANWMWKCERRKTKNVAEVLTWEVGDNRNQALKTERQAGVGVQEGVKRYHCYKVGLRPLATTKWRQLAALELKWGLGAKEKDLNALATPTT